jgi:hypothetical protein
MTWKGGLMRLACAVERIAATESYPPPPADPPPPVLNLGGIVLGTIFRGGQAATGFMSGLVQILTRYQGGLPCASHRPITKSVKVGHNDHIACRWNIRLWMPSLQR